MTRNKKKPESVMGRPRVPDHEKYSITHPLKVTAAQKVAFQEFAKIIFQTSAGFLRQAAHYYIANPPQHTQEEAKTAKYTSPINLLLTENDHTLCTDFAKNHGFKSLNQFFRTAAQYFIDNYK